MLAADEVRQLQRLALASGSTSSSTGARITRARGDGLEFHDYRPYQAGDDPRSIDWTIDARHHQLVVRLFQAEGHTRLQLLVDTSRSMAIGEPTKLSFAVRVAAALCYVAIDRRDPAGLTTFDATVRSHLPPAGGRRQLFRVLDVLRALVPDGRSDLDAAMRAYASVVRGPGLVVVLSDFLGSPLRLEGLQYLIYKGLTPAVVQILADEDIDPRVSGELELRDSEDDAAVPLIVDASAIASYRTHLAEVGDTLRAFCVTHRLPWLSLPSSSTFAGTLTACRQAGLLAWIS